MSNSITTNTNTNKTKELLNMFWASVYIQEEFMWQKPEQNNKFSYGHYKKTYRVILEEIQEFHKDIKNSIEAKVFKLGDSWGNDLFDIVDMLIKEEFGTATQENKDEYFAKFVQKYVDEYIKHFINNSQ